MKFRVERDLTVREDRPEYKIMYFTDSIAMWLTYNTDRFRTEEEAEKAIKKIKNGKTI